MSLNSMQKIQLQNRGDTLQLYSAINSQAVRLIMVKYMSGFPFLCPEIPSSPTVRPPTGPPSAHPLIIYGSATPGELRVESSIKEMCVQPGT